MLQRRFIPYSPFMLCLSFRHSFPFFQATPNRRGQYTQPEGTDYRFFPFDMLSPPSPKGTVMHGQTESLTGTPITFSVPKGERLGAVRLSVPGPGTGRLSPPFRHSPLDWDRRVSPSGNAIPSPLVMRRPLSPFPFGDWGKRLHEWGKNA